MTALGERLLRRAWDADDAEPNEPKRVRRERCRACGGLIHSRDLDVGCVCYEDDPGTTLTFT